MRNKFGTLNFTTVGLAFAGSALFVLGFHQIVDSSKTPSLSETMRNSTAAVSSVYKQVTTFQPALPAPIQGSMYAADHNVENWINHQLTSTSDAH